MAQNSEGKKPRATAVLWGEYMRRARIAFQTLPIAIMGPGGLCNGYYLRRLGNAGCEVGDIRQSGHLLASARITVYGSTELAFRAAASMLRKDDQRHLAERLELMRARQAREGVVSVVVNDSPLLDSERPQVMAGGTYDEPSPDLSKLPQVPAELAKFRDALAGRVSLTANFVDEPPDPSRARGDEPPDWPPRGVVGRSADDTDYE